MVSTSGIYVRLAKVARGHSGIRFEKLIEIGGIVMQLPGNFRDGLTGFQQHFFGKVQQFLFVDITRRYAEYVLQCIAEMPRMYK